MTTANNRINEQVVKVTDDLREMGSAIRNAAQEQVVQLRHNTAKYYEQGRHKILDVACSCEQLIGERPFQSLFVAAVVGLLFGRFGMRR